MEGTRGPNLQAPKPHLRIIPGKLSGSPHIVSTRIETIAISALRDRGFDHEKIHQLYPVVAPVAIAEAIDLERQLRANLNAAPESRHAGGMLGGIRRHMEADRNPDTLSGFLSGFVLSPA